MIRILILLIIGAAALAIAYFTFKSVPLAKKMLIVGGGLVAAILGTTLQMGNPFYMALLAVVGVSLLATLVYMKVLEKQQIEKQRLAEERRTRLNTASLQQNQKEPNPINENNLNKTFSMQSIDMGKEERKLG